MAKLVGILFQEMAICKARYTVPRAALHWSVVFLIWSVACAGFRDRAHSRPGESPAEGPFLGKLIRVLAIGGETTGWSVQLDSQRELADGTRVDHIEVDPRPAGIRLEPFANKRVAVTGLVSWRDGVERGRYPVLILETIQEQEP